MLFLYTQKSVIHERFLQVTLQIWQGKKLQKLSFKAQPEEQSSPSSSLDGSQCSFFEPSEITFKFKF